MCFVDFWLIMKFVDMLLRILVIVVFFMLIYGFYFMEVEGDFGDLEKIILGL